MIALGESDEGSRASFIDSTYDAPRFDGGDHTEYGQGYYAFPNTSDITLALSANACKSEAIDTIRYHSYSVRSEGCETYLELGNGNVRVTLKRRNTP